MAKSLLIGLCALLGLGAIAFGVLGALSLPAAGEHAVVTVAEVTLRPLPTLSATAAPVPTPAAATDGGAAPAPVPVAEVDAGIAAPAPAPVPAPPVPPAPIPAPVPAAKPDAGVAAAPKPPAPAPPPVAPAADGLLTLRASDTADVYVDGKKVGTSPVEGLKVKAGAHKVRFDCYDASGNTTPGAAKTVTVPADGEQTLEFECPAAE